MSGNRLSKPSVLTYPTTPVGWGSTAPRGCPSVVPSCMTTFPNLGQELVIVGFVIDRHEPGLFLEQLPSVRQTCNNAPQQIPTWA